MFILFLVTVFLRVFKCKSIDRDEILDLWGFLTTFWSLPLSPKSFPSIQGPRVISRNISPEKKQNLCCTNYHFLISIKDSVQFRILRWTEVFSNFLREYYLPVKSIAVYLLVFLCCVGFFSFFYYILPFTFECRFSLHSEY